jgi:hypothetical protein
MSPPFVIRVLERFDIEIPDFLEALPAVKKGPQRL